MSRQNKPGQWDLESIYAGLSDDAFVTDKKQMREHIRVGREILGLPPLERLARGLAWWEELYKFRKKLFPYLILRNAVATSNYAILSELKNYRSQQVEADDVIIRLQKTIADIDLEEFFAAYPQWREYSFFLRQKQKLSESLLSETEENVLASITGAGAQNWSQMVSALVARERIDFNGEKVGLSDLQAGQKAPELALREKAYRAELATYSKLELPAAYALNSIKAHAAATARLRGYDSPLARTLALSRLTRKTLNSMLRAVEGWLPAFQKFLAAKEKLISGHERVAWYNIWAPLGDHKEHYSVERANSFILDLFADFHPPLAEVIRRAFQEQWIDFYPRPGKTGGAFCFNLPLKCQSRILVNYKHDLASVKTLVHELGHAYHGSVICRNKPLNQEYTLPLAETASTFNETHFYATLLERQQTDQGRKYVLNDWLSAAVLFICDMYSRFRFEQKVFLACEERFLSPADLCQFMSEAQSETYGSSLNPELGHPYMWIAKDHYYSLRVNYYNFPYIFGNLLAVGLYRRYQRDGLNFLDLYDHFLARTGNSTCEDIALGIGIDLTEVDFWQDSLEFYGGLIDQFLALA
ncbi:MAG TPA: M3 family oligoendopeptidase [Clostridiaceae bacterium]|nr:M3 family oligoendopeptidase [Clostridiaceae bacterium]